MTPEQRKALEPLTEKRRRFVLAYVGEAGGVALQAARLAGYAKPHPEGAKLLQNPTVAAAIKAFQVPAQEAAIMELDELRRFWMRVLLGEETETTVTTDGTQVEVVPKMRDRLKASELLGKSLGAFIDRQEIETKGQSLVLFGSLEDAKKWAKGDGR